MGLKKIIKNYWFFASIFSLASFFRLVNLNIIPVFADEAIYIHWAQIAWHDHTQRFISLTDGKPPIHTWLMIPFLKVIKDPLVAGRLLSVLTGLFTVVGIYLIVKEIFDKKTALTAAFLTAISPFLVFYDRLAVADSLLTAFGVWSFYLGLQLIKAPDLGKSFLLGFCWAGGLLTKQPALYFLVLFPTLFLIEKPHNFKKLLGYIGVAVLIAFLGYNIIKLSPYSHLISVRSYDYILGKREFLRQPFQLFWGNLKAILIWVVSYQTIFQGLLFFLGLFLLIKKNWKKGMVFLIWFVIPVLGSAAIGKIIFPRYFLFIEPWIIVFITYGLVFLIEKIKTKPLLIALVLPWLIFSGLIVFKPTKAPLIKREQDQYLTTWSSGYGIKQIANYLKQKYPQEKVYVATEGYFGTLPDGLQIYLDGFGNIEVYGVGQPLESVPENTLENAKKAPTYLIINDSRYLGTDQNLELINKFAKPEFSFLKESLLFFKIKEE